MNDETINMTLKNWITWGFALLAVIAFVIAFAVGGWATAEKLLPFYGIGFGIVLIVDAIFYLQLFVNVRATSEKEYRVSCGILGLIFIVLGILILAGVIP